jgi:hypothetical protein
MEQAVACQSAARLNIPRAVLAEAVKFQLVPELSGTRGTSEILFVGVEEKDSTSEKKQESRKTELER